MAKTYSLPVPHYLQDDCYSDTNEMCGAACAQMVLHDINPGRVHTPGEQQELYKRIKAMSPTTSNWYNPPQGIRGVLDQEKPRARRNNRGTTNLPHTVQAIFDSIPVEPATTYRFAILGSVNSVNNPGIRRASGADVQKAQIELLSRLLIRTVAVNGAAPIVAVREDNAHWIVVNGFQVTDDYDDTNLIQQDKIEAILIRNPLGRYTYRTITCGPLTEEKMREITGHQCEGNPYVQDVVAYETWVGEYMFSDWAETFVAVGDWPAQDTCKVIARLRALGLKNLAFSRMTWAEIFVAVCDWFTQDTDKVMAHLRASVPKKLALSSATTEKGSRDLEVNERKGDPEEITPGEARVQAERAIDNFNLSQQNGSVTPQNILEPVKVKRLDRIDGDYYLVPVGGENNISALINISIKGKFNEATVWPGKHYIAPFERHPNFRDLTSGPKSPLCGRKIRLAAGRPPLKITSVNRDQTTPYVWRPCPESFSAFRPFHNLKLTVEGHRAPISLYVPMDDHCLPDDPNDPGAISLPSANYLELLTDCIKQKAVNITRDVLVSINNAGNTALVKYKSSQTMEAIKAELEVMERIICQCLKAHPSAGLPHFRIKAFATNAFLMHGGGDGVPLGTAPASGGGDGFSINSCS